MKQFIRNIINQLLLQRRYRENKKMFNNYFNRIISYNSLSKPPQNDNFNRWLKKWSVFGYTPTHLSWHAFSTYMNENIDFVPNDVGRNFIEPILIPEEYQPFYNDKNSFGIFMDKSWMPKTFFRSINGMSYNEDYEPVSEKDFYSLFNGIDEVVVKPAKDMGGKGITLFKRVGENFVDEGNNTLSLEYLQKNYNTNYLIQECIKQSDYMAQFNPTSVNTLRIATYRNVKTGEVHVVGSVLRIGAKGAFVDNISSGGSSIFVYEDGRLGKFVRDKYGKTRTHCNDIDFENNEFVIPEWDRVKQFVCDIAKRMPHMSLFANDITIDSKGNPRLIEVNTTMISYSPYQYNGKAVFGEYTDDLIEHCLKENKKIKPSIFLKSN